MKRPVNPANLHAKVEAIESLIARIPSAPTDWQQETTIYKPSHGLAVGDPVQADGTKATTPDHQTLGAVSRILSPDAVLVVTSGIVSGLSGLTTGQLLGVADYPTSPNWNETAVSQLGRIAIYGLAISDYEAFVFPSKVIHHGPATQSLSCWVSTSAAITDIGQVVGPTTTPPQADTRAHSLVTGVVVVALPGGAWLVANAGSWTTQVSAAHPLYAGGTGVRYLSAATAGAATATEPTLSVPVYHVATGTRTDYPSDPSPATYYVTITPLLAAAQAPGVLPLELGGAGTDLSAQPNHAVLFKFNNTQLGSVINTGGLLSVLTQVSSGLPVFKSLDDDAFADTGTGIRPKICTEQTDDTAPSEGQFLRFVAGLWTPYGMPMVNAGEVLAYDGADLVRATAGTARSVFGNPTAADGIPQAIPASADGQLLASSSGGLVWLSEPTTDGQVLTRVSGSLAWVTPSAAGGGYTTSTIFTSGGTYTVPAGKTRIKVVAIGAGGGSGGLTSACEVTIGYVAATSGGSPTTRVYHRSWIGNGGHGATVTAEFDVTPGETLTISIGTGGAAGTAGNGGSSGGTTSVTRSGVSISAGGGEGSDGNSNSGGNGGTASVTISSARNPIIFTAKGSRGKQGQSGLYGSGGWSYTFASNTTDDSNDPDGVGSNSASRYGYGGSGPTTYPSAGSAGSNGVVAVIA